MRQLKYQRTAAMMRIATTLNFEEALILHHRQARGVARMYGLD